MEKENGYFVFTPLSGEQFVKIHRDDCMNAHRDPGHPDRSRSWHWYPTYNAALEYSRTTGRSYKNGLDCQICRPS